MTLVGGIGQHAQFNRQLVVLGESVNEVLEIIESAIVKPRSEGKSQKEATPRPLMIMLGLLALRFRTVRFRRKPELGFITATMIYFIFLQS